MTASSGHFVCGDHGVAYLKKPNYALGDARFLRPDWPHPIQIRQVVCTDFVDGIIYETGFTMVVKRMAPGAYLRATIRLPSHLCVNEPDAADAAWRHIEKTAPHIAAAEREMRRRFRHMRRKRRTPKYL